MEKISNILDANFNIYERVVQDLGTVKNDTGANGMSAEQIVRAAIIKQMEGYSYERLAFHQEAS